MIADEEPSGALLSVVECHLEEPPAKVWRALTTPEIIAEWLLPATTAGPIEAAGDGFTLDGAPLGAGEIRCRVVEAQPGRRLSYAWFAAAADGRAGAIETLVTFELRETGTGGTHLRIAHSAVPAALPERAPTIMGAVTGARRPRGAVHPDRRRTPRGRTYLARPPRHPAIRLRRAA